MRYLLTSYIVLFAFGLVNGQKPRIQSMSLSFERLVSDIVTGLEVRDPQFHPDPHNLPKRTYSINAQTTVDLYKNMFHLSVNIGYDERKALEIFPFYNTGLAVNTAINTSWVLAGVPTSPQNPKFEEFNSYNDFPEFPNFEYLNLAFVPSYEFRFKRLGVNVGVGIFYNYLLNKEDLVFGREWFPWTDFIFDEPFYVSGEISYNTVDFGYIRHAEFSYRVSDRFRIFINARYLKSKAVLNTRTERYGSQKWRVWKYGIGIEYIFHVDDKEEYKFFR